MGPSKSPPPRANTVNRGQRRQKEKEWVNPYALTPPLFTKKKKSFITPNIMTLTMMVHPYTHDPHSSEGHVAEFEY